MFNILFLKKTTLLNEYFFGFPDESQKKFNRLRRMKTLTRIILLFVRKNSNQKAAKLIFFPPIWRDWVSPLSSGKWRKNPDNPVNLVKKITLLITTQRYEHVAKRFSFLLFPILHFPPIRTDMLQNFAHPLT